MKTKSILFCFVFALCANINTSHAQVNVQDSLALVDLYNSTDGPHWARQHNWLTHHPVTTWQGITVSANRVIWIYLRANNLKGTIPSSLANCTNLQLLGLLANHLSGS